MIDISNVQGKLIGVSFLNETEQQIVKELWHNAFSQTDAFWVEADDTDTAREIVQKVFSGIREAGATALAGKTCELVLFLDYSGERKRDYSTAISNLATTVRDALFCSIPLELQYVYIGTNPILKSGADQLKKAILSLTDDNYSNNQISKRACLIARNMISAEENTDHWNSAIIYLDVLRRNSVFDVLPTVGTNGNDDVCFIRYGEYDGRRYIELSQRVQELDQRRGSFGFSELKAEIDKRLRNLENEARSRFQVSARNQPIHPDMKVEGFFKIQKAKKGNNAEFTAAQMHTRNALLKTGEALSEGIKKIYKDELHRNAKNYLEALLQSCSVGIELLSDRKKINELFDGSMIGTMRPQLPGLVYNESGYEQEIGTYLEQVRNCAIAEAKKNYLESLQDAYKLISDEEIAQKKIEINQQLADANAQLALVPSEKDFIEGANDTAGSTMLSFFSPINPGGVTKRLIVDSTVGEAQRHESMANKEVTIMLLPEIQATIASTRPKALQLLSFDCDRNRLDDLIREVDM